jgi:heme oxygenase
MSAIAELRSATWGSHQRLERRLDVKARFSDSRAYRTHLEKMWGFCAGIELRVGPYALGAAEAAVATFTCLDQWLCGDAA